jgi:hypothetical protein
MNHSSRNHHRQTTRLVTGVSHGRHDIEAQTGWEIDTFVRNARSCRVVKITADNQIRTATDTLSNALVKIRADVRSSLRRVG